MSNRIRTRVFFDTETTGLFKNTKKYDFYNRSLIANDKNIQIFDTSRILSMSCVKFYGNKIISTKNWLLKPNGFTEVPNSAFKVHGISYQKVMEEGITLEQFFNELNEFLKDTDLLIAHNMQYDSNVLLSECYRYKQEELIKKLSSNIKLECTMLLADEILKKNRKIKDCKLATVYEYFNNKKLDGAHSADKDTEACYNIYWKMKKITRNEKNKLKSI